MRVLKRLLPFLAIAGILLCASYLVTQVTLDYDKFALSFMQVTSTDRYNQNKDWILSHTDESIRSEVDAYLANSNFSNTMNVAITEKNVQTSGDTTVAFYIIECRANDYGYLAATTFTFEDNLLTEYKIYTVAAL